MRRYLWLMALELVESDGVDAMPPVEKKPKLDNFAVDSFTQTVPVSNFQSPVATAQSIVAVDKYDAVPDFDNLTVVHDWVIEFGKNCTSKADLVAFWNSHKKQLKEMETHMPNLYEDAVANFKKFKENLTRSENGQEV